MPSSGPRSTTDASWSIATCGGSAPCCLLDETGWLRYTDAIGPEPLDAGLHPRAARYGLAAARGQAVKKVLMDQRHLAGVGNIYANEALFAAGIDPSKPARRLTAGRPPPAARGDPTHPRGGDRLERDHRPRLPDRHRTSRAISSSSCSSTGARASRAGAAAPGSPAPTRSTPGSRSSATAANREPRAAGPSASPRSRPPTSTSSEAGCARSPRTGPAVYRMTDATGRIIYVGKAKRLRTRLLTYFRAEYPDDKAARILYAASDIALGLRAQRVRRLPRRAAPDPELPPATSTHRGNVTRRSVLIKVAERPRPSGVRGRHVARDDVRCYGPFRSMARTLEAVRTLNDLLGLRDCAADDARGVRRPGRPVRPSRARRGACGTSSASAADRAPAS